MLLWVPLNTPVSQTLSIKLQCNCLIICHCKLSQYTNIIIIASSHINSNTIAWSVTCNILQSFSHNAIPASKVCLRFVAGASAGFSYNTSGAVGPSWPISPLFFCTKILVFNLMWLHKVLITKAQVSFLPYLKRYSGSRLMWTLLDWEKVITLSEW